MRWGTHRVPLFVFRAVPDGEVGKAGLDPCRLMRQGSGEGKNRRGTTSISPSNFFA
jgi:hypothetical protein